MGGRGMPLTFYPEAAGHLTYRAQASGEECYRRTIWIEREYEADRRNAQRARDWKPDVFRLVRARFDEDQAAAKMEAALAADTPDPMAKIVHLLRRTASCFM